MNKLETNAIFKGELSRGAGSRRLSKEELVHLQKVIYEITRDITDLCEEHHIPYMLGGGTLLGAVRHKGFIPWDDDVDLNVERRYIPKLLRLIRERYKGVYRVYEPVTDKGYYRSFIEVQKIGTVFREYPYQKDEECGIKLDIFVIENTYDNKLRRTIHGLGSNAGLLLLSCYRMYAHREDYLALAGGNDKAQQAIRKKARIGRLVAIAPRLVYVCVQRWMAKCRNHTSGYVVIPSGKKHFFGELYERHPYCDTMAASFEDSRLRISKDYKRYLTRLYGPDYMQLPPEEEREYHIVCGLDFGEEI